MGYDALAEMFRRMAFNVCSDATDDHSKNFSFLLEEGRFAVSGDTPKRGGGQAFRDFWQLNADFVSKMCVAALIPRQKCAILCGERCVTDEKRYRNRVFSLERTEES